MAPIALDIFSGRGSWSKAVRQAGLSAIDIDIHQDFDLTMRSNQLFVEGLLKAGLVVALHLGTPCNYFTSVRERVNGPGELLVMSSRADCPSCR